MSFRKDARAALDSRDYENAISICEYGLEADKSDYFLYVFKAVALKNLFRYKEALEIFEKASDVAPDQLIVWKGYLDILGRFEDMSKRQKLQEVLRNLIRLTSGDEKRQYSFQLVNFLEDTKKFREAAELLTSLASQEEGQEFQISKRLRDLWSLWESDEIKKRIEKERFRLSNDSFEMTTRKVTAQVYSESHLTGLLINEQNENHREEILNRLDIYCPNEYNEMYKRLINELKLSSKLAAKKYLEILDVSSLTEYPRDVVEFLGDDFCLWILSKTHKLVSSSASGPFQSFVYCFYLFDNDQFSKCLKAISSTINGPCGEKQMLALKRLKGICLYKLGEYSDSVIILNEFKDEDCRIYLVDAYDKLNRHDLSAELLPIGSIKRAWQLYKSGQIDRLITELSDEHLPDWLILRGLVLWHKNEDIPAALKLWKEALDIDDSFALAYNYTGLYYLKQKSFTKAEENLTRAVDLDKANPEPRLFLSHLWIQTGKFSQAINLLQDVRKKNWKVRFYMGLSFEYLEHFEDASTSFLEALKLFRRDTDDLLQVDELAILRHLGNCYLRDGKLKSALRAYKKLKELVKDDNDKLEINLGLINIYLQDSQLEEALHLIMTLKNSLTRLNLLRSLAKAATDAFDKDIISKLKEELASIKVKADWNSHELFFFSDLLNILKVSDFKVDIAEEILPRSIIKQSNNSSFILCQIGKLSSKSDSRLTHRINDLLLHLENPENIHFVASESKEILGLLNEAIEGNDLEKFERVCILDPSGCQGLAWIGRYLLTGESSFLLSAMEWLTDAGWLKFCVLEVIREGKYNIFENEIIITSVERLSSISDSDPWVRKLLGLMLEKQGLVEEAAQYYSDDKDIERINVLLGRNQGESDNSLNKLTLFYKEDEDKAFEFMSQLGPEQTIPFTFAIQTLGGGEKTSIPEYSFPSPYQQWQWTKLIYASSRDPSRIAQFFKSINSNLFSLYVALDVLTTFPNDEVLREMVKERKHSWQDVYEDVNGASRGGKTTPHKFFYSKIGKRFYDQIISKL